MARINDGTDYGNVTPADGDGVIGTDISNTAKHANGETVEFLFSAMSTYFEGKALGYNAQTGATYTAVLSDRIITMSNASTNTLTIPTNASVAFPTGSKMEVWMIGAGTTIIAGDTGVTLQGAGGSASAGSCDIQQQYTAATLTKIATNTWLVGGNIDAVA